MAPSGGRKLSLIGTPRGLTNGGERPAVKPAKLGGRVLDAKVSFLVPVVVGLLAAVLLFAFTNPQSFENARLALAAAGVAVVAVAGLLILRFR